ncbi:MAG: isomerase, partial [Micavibrio aeruginosavorus]
ELHEVTFDTKFVGPLNVKKDGASYTMNFPSRPGEKVEISDIPEFVLDAVSPVKPAEAYKARDLMLVYGDKQAVLDIKPDFNTLLKYKDFIIVTAKDDGKYDFISRFFCADDAITEDPVTGSAHCTSAPYWANKLAKNEMLAYQASKRGGELSLKSEGDRLLITGDAVTVIKGEIIL